jgi:hypothetical protein
MQCVENSRKQRNRDLNAGFNLYRLRTTDQERKERLAFLKPDIRKKERYGRNNPQRLILVIEGSDPNVSIYARVKKPAPHQ